MLTRKPISLFDASVLYDLYADSPTYFAAIGSVPPTLQEVAIDLGQALKDAQRRLELLYTHSECVGYLDYKLDYPKPKDITINLLLIPDRCRSQDYDSLAVQDLESSLQDRFRQVMVGVFAADRSSERFWVEMGYHFLRDARPLMCWYAKAIGAESTASALDSTQEQEHELPT